MPHQLQHAVFTILFKHQPKWGSNMRFIKFRTTPKSNLKTIELVRVSDNGRIVPKGYGPLELQVLDNNPRNMGTSLQPSKILCFGATESVDDIRITGTVDVYVEGIDEPILTNVTEQQLAEMTAGDFQHKLEPYIAEPLEPTEDFQFFTYAGSDDWSLYVTLTMIAGVKFVDDPVVKWGTSARIDNWELSQGVIEYRRVDEIPQGFQSFFSQHFGIDVECTLTTKPLIAPVDIFDKLKHGAYYKKFIPFVINNNPVTGTVSANFPTPYTLDFKLTLPEGVEYIVIPSTVKPYGNNYEYSRLLLNNTMLHDNVVYYPDGRIVKNDPAVATLPTESLYQQDAVTKVDLGEVVAGEAKVIDISSITPQIDQPSLTMGRYFDIVVPSFEFTYMKLSYVSAVDKTPYQTQGIHWIDNAVNGREATMSSVALEWFGAFVLPSNYRNMTDSGENAEIQIDYPDPGRVYRFKFPEDVTEFTFLVVNDS